MIIEIALFTSVSFTLTPKTELRFAAVSLTGATLAVGVAGVESVAVVVRGVEEDEDDDEDGEGDAASPG